MGAFKVAAHAQGLIATTVMAHPIEPLADDVAERIVAITRAAGLLGE